MLNDMTDCLEKTTPNLNADDIEISSSSDNFDTLIENLNYDLTTSGSRFLKINLNIISQNQRLCSLVT